MRVQHLDQLRSLLLDIRSMVWLATIEATGVCFARGFLVCLRFTYVYIFIYIIKIYIYILHIYVGFFAGGFKGFVEGCLMMFDDV